MLRRWKTISLLTRTLTRRNLVPIFTHHLHTQRYYNTKPTSSDPKPEEPPKEKPVHEEIPHRTTIQEQPLSQNGGEEKQQEKPKKRKFLWIWMVLLASLATTGYLWYIDRLPKQFKEGGDYLKNLVEKLSKQEKQEKKRVVANVEQEKVQEAPSAIEQPVKETEMILRQRTLELQKEVDDLRQKLFELTEREDRLKKEMEEYKKQLEEKKKLEEKKPFEGEQIKDEKWKELEKEKEYQELLKKELAKKEEELVKKMNKLLEDQEKKFKEELKAQEELHIAITDELLAEQQKKFEEQYREEREKRINTLRDLTTKVYALESCFDANADYLRDSLNLQKLIISIYSLEETLRSNGPFKPEIDSILNAYPDDPVITTLLKSIPEPVALSGVLPKHELKKQFNRIYREVLQASYAPDNTGLAGYIFSKIVGLFIIPEKGLVNGDTVDARLARARFLLESDRLAEAYQEVAPIDGLAGKVIEPWREQVRKRLIADQALMGMKAHVMNLLNAIQRN